MNSLKKNNIEMVEQMNKEIDWQKKHLEELNKIEKEKEETMKINNQDHKVLTDLQL